MGIASTAGGLGVAGAIAPAAYAGPWAVEGCSVNGSPAPIAGWVSGGNPGNYSGAFNNCASGGYFGVQVSEAYPQPAGENVLWTFSPPAGATILGGSITGALIVPYGQGGQADFASPGSGYDGANVIANCQWNLPCPQSAAAPGASAVAGTWPIHPGGNVYAIASCGGLPGGGGCPGGYGPPSAAEVAIANSSIELSAPTTPSASGFSGSLLTPKTHGTAATLQFTATEAAPGPGIETVRVLIDGTAAYSGVPDSNGGSCAPVGTDPAGVAEYTSLTPCSLSAAIALPIDVSGLADGEHHLSITVTDAAGVSATVLDQTITTAQRTTVAAQLAKVAPAAAAAVAAAAAGDGRPCNAGCDPNAILQPAAAAAARTPTVSYAHSPFVLSGRLLDHTGAGMAGAQVELRQRPAAAGASDELVATATTSATGAWSFDVPPGPSRQLMVGYRAHLGDPAFAAQLARNQAVLAAATLSAPRRTRAGHRIVLRGQLAGGFIPPGGEAVAVEIHYVTHWRTIGVVRTDQAGHYRYPYAFANANVPLGRYRFRAVPIASAAYPFGSHASGPVTIEVL